MDADNKNSNAYAYLGWVLLFGLLIVSTYYITQSMKLAQKPAMPITVSVRESMLGSGLVAQFSNHSDRFIGLLVTFTNPTTNQTMKSRLDIDANSMREVGHLEGWSFVSADQILIEHHDYQASLITVQ